MSEKNEELKDENEVGGEIEDNLEEIASATRGVKRELSLLVFLFLIWFSCSTLSNTFNSIGKNKPQKVDCHCDCSRPD